MPVIELTSEGITRQTFTEMRDEIEAELRANLQRPNLDAHSASSFLGNLNNAFCGRLDLVCQAIESLHDMFDPDRADAPRFRALARLNGLEQKAATQGTCVLTCTFDDVDNVSAGDIEIYPDGQDLNVWTNDDALIIDAPGVYEVSFTSTLFGAEATLPIGEELTIGAGPDTLTTVELAMNDNLTPGQNAETIAQFRRRRQSGTQAFAVTPKGAIETRLEQMTSVFDATVVEVSPGVIEVVVWDDSVPNDRLAQAIFDHKAPGIVTTGSESGTATDSKGQQHVVYFSRPVTVPVYVYATILGNPSTQDLADAILEYGATLGANSSVDGPAVLSAVRSTIGVRKVTAFRVTRTSGLAPAAGVIDTSDVMISARSVANLAQANFHFTISP